MPESKIQTSFAAGELSPTLYARVDIDKFQVGAALMRNFYVDWRGGASNRAGTKYVNKCQQAGARLIPFDFSTSITYMMEFGNEYIRFYTSGQPVLELALPVLGFTIASPGVWFIPLHGYSTGDEVILAAPNMKEFDERQLLVGTVVDADHVIFTDLFGNEIDTTGLTFAGAMSSSRIYTLVSPYLTADLFDINFVQSADVITLVHPSYIPYNLSRISDSIFQLEADSIGPIALPPTSLAAVGLGGSYKYGYVVTALNEDATEESLPSFPAEALSPLLDQTTVPMKAINLAWVAPANQIVSAYNVYKWGPVDATNGSAPTIFGYIGQTKSTTFSDTNIAADFSQVPPQFEDPLSPGQIQNIEVTDGGSAYTHSYEPLTITGDGTGAIAYGVTDYATGAIVGVWLVESGQNYTEATVSPPSGAATFTAQLSQLTGGFPSVTSYVQQRRAYAATDNDPQGMVLSQTGNYDNFNVSPVVEDSDAITIRLASTEVDYIQSMVPMSTGLVILTSGGAWLLSGGSPGAPITPSETTATRQASHGANRLPGIVWNYNVLYMQAKGNTVRDLAFNFYLQSYVGNDRSYLSQHLFTNFNFIQWCAAEEPLKLIWIVRDDGVLLTMTYLPEQEVYGWAHHDTQGLFRSIATVSEGTVDAVYVIVSRYVQPGADCGTGWYDFIERFDDRKFDCTEDVWFLDCALSNDKSFPPFTIYDSGPLSDVGGNVEVCAPPDTNLYGTSGLTGKVTNTRLNFTSSSSASAHGLIGIFDWDAGKLYQFQAWNGTTDPETNGTTLFIFDLASQEQLAGPINPGEFAFTPGTSQACLGYDGNVYYATADDANRIGQFNTSTFSNVGYDDSHSLPQAGYIAPLTDGTNEYVLATGINSGTGGGSSSPCYLVQMTPTREAIQLNSDTSGVYEGSFDEQQSSLAPGNAYPLRGPLGCAFVLVHGQTGGAGQQVLGLYLISLKEGFFVISKLGVIPGSAVVGAWTSIDAFTWVYDEFDGNLLVEVVGSDTTHRLIKISTADASILWVLNIGGGNDFRESRIKFGKFTFVGETGGGNTDINQINTVTGTYTTTVETVLAPAAFATSDIMGEVVINVNSIGDNDWATFGAQSPTAWIAPGQVVQIGCGKIEVITNDDSWESHGTVLTPVLNQIPGDPDGNTLPIPTGDYSVATPTNTMTGLWHLEGKTVMAVADGNVVGPFTVVNGSVTLPHPATNIVVGLAYQAQLQTLYLDVPQGPNMQGKRKTLPAATLRVTDTRGPKIGRTFDDLVEMPELMVVPGVTPMPLQTGDFRAEMFSDWEVTGQMVVQQDYPLPITVLGIIPEFVRGDTAN